MPAEALADFPPGVKRAHAERPSVDPAIAQVTADTAGFSIFIARIPHLR
jgi:hypothetical protein